MNDEKPKKVDKKEDKWEKDFSVNNILKPATGFPERSEELVFNEFAAEATRFLIEADQHAAKGQIDDAAEALCAATMGGAYVMFAEDILGSIEVGKLADFVVIPVDYMTIPAEDIWKIEPEMTVIGGDVVYTRPADAGK